MHIKSLKISGFKSYKDQVTQDEDFSEGFNVIVGRNGAGKSNLFSATVFCTLFLIERVRWSSIDHLSSPSDPPDPFEP